jgi:ferredoxin-NADP reductase
MAIPEYQFKLTSCNWITKNVKHFCGELIDTPSFDFIPGQFITILFEHEQKILRRSYSIANAPQDKTIEFAASYVEGGPGSAYLFSRNPGDELKITGPFGRLILKPEIPQQRIFLVATSTGITPYRSMLTQIQSYLTKNTEVRVEILEGAQTKDQLLFTQDFLKFCQQYPHQAQFSAALSRESNPCDDLEFETFHGYVQDILKQKALNPDHDLIYLCGNPKMIDDTTELLKNMNFNIQNIIREKYISR